MHINIYIIKIIINEILEYLKKRIIIIRFENLDIHAALTYLRFY